MLYLAAEADDNAGFDFSQDAEAMHSATAAADKQLEVLRGPLHGIALMAGSARAKVGRRGVSQKALSPGGSWELPPGCALLTADGEVAVSSRSAARRRVRAMRMRAGLDPTNLWAAADACRACCRS